MSGSPQSHKPLLFVASVVVLILATLAITGVAATDPYQAPASATQASTMLVPF